MVIANLEDELRPKLQDALVAIAGNVSSRGAVARCRNETGSADAVRIGVVEQVEGLAAELEMHRFGNVQVFEQTGIDAPPSRTLNHVALCVSAANLARRDGSKSIDVKPVPACMDRIARCSGIW